MNENENLAHFKIKPLAIGIGQGGGNIAKAINSAFKNENKTILINTSSADIMGAINPDIDQKRIIKLGDHNVIEGTGKDRKYAMDMLPPLVDIITTGISNLLIADDIAYNVLFVCFSTAGGTGSGMGPKITALLNSAMFSKALEPKYGTIAPIVFGIAATPSLTLDEGTISLENTLECLDDMNKIISRDYGRYIIIDNGSFVEKTSVDNNKAGNSKSRVNQLKFINESAAGLLLRYFNDYNFSRISTVDKNDRLRSLQIMGLHSFNYVIQKENSFETLNTFFIPDGERVRRITYEVREDMEESILNYFRIHGILSDDFIHGFFEENDKNNDKKSIISYHGFKNISKIAEKFANKLQQIKELAMKTEQSSQSTSHGLNDLEKEKLYRSEEYGKKQADSYQDILNLK
jgi:hypothetical protein